MPLQIPVLQQNPRVCESTATRSVVSAWRRAASAWVSASAQACAPRMRACVKAKVPHAPRRQTHVGLCRFIETGGGAPATARTTSACRNIGWDGQHIRHTQRIRIRDDGSRLGRDQLLQGLQDGQAACHEMSIALFCEPLNPVVPRHDSLNTYPALARLGRHAQQPSLIIKPIPWGESDRACHLRPSHPDL